MKQLIKIYFSIAAIALLIFSSCETNKVTGLSLNKTELSMLLGDKDTLIANVDYSGNIVPSVSWTSSDSKIVTVNNGAIKAIKKGSATITATAGEKSATCIITVVDAISPVFTSASIEFWGDYYETEMSNNHLLILTNKKDTLYLEVNTALTAKTTIPNGAYNMLGDFKDASDFIPFSIIPAFESEGYGYGSWFFNNLTDNALESGLLTVSQINDKYSFVYEFTDYEGLTISGSFSGVATFTDNSDLSGLPLEIKKQKIKSSKVLKVNRNSFRN